MFSRCARISFFALGITFGLAGCASSDVEELQQDLDLLVTDEAKVPCADCSDSEPAKVADNHYIKMEDNSSKLNQVKISATGYGAPPKSYYPDGQRRLMALRAAKLDALRSLAERINGIRIWGGTTIGNMVVEKDRYRAILDAYVRGATVVSVSPIDDGNYEAVVEIIVDQKFLAYVLPSEQAQRSGVGSVPGMNSDSSGAINSVPTMFYYSE